MSQKKVDQYKSYKNNRQKVRQHEKRMARVELFFALVIAVAFIGWFAYSIYDTVTHSGDNGSTVEATEIDVNDYLNYVSGLQTSYSA